MESGHTRAAENEAGFPSACGTGRALGVARKLRKEPGMKA